MYTTTRNDEDKRMQTVNDVLLVLVLVCRYKCRCKS